MSRLQDVLIRGLRIDQPLPTEVSPGTVYVVIDEAFLQEQSDGTFWEQFGPTPGGGGGGGGLDQLTGDVAAGPGTGSQVATIQPNAVTTPKILNAAVTNAKLADVPTATFKGRTTAGTSSPEDLTTTQATAMLAPFVGDTGTGGVKGLVPAPAAGDAGLGKLLMADGTWAVPPAGGSEAGLINVRVITTVGAGTYTPTTGTTNVIIELVGGGGGGGAVPSPGGGNVHFGTGGGGGAWLMKRLTTNFAGAAYTVGAKGNGGAAGANNGTAGGNTTFTSTGGSPTIYTAGGGIAGGRTGNFAPPLVAFPIVNGGTATNGDLNVSGGACSVAMCPNVFAAQTSQGGGSRYAGNVTGAGIGADASAVGGPATGYGGGGGGAVALGTGVARAGGNGSDGLILIWEYGSPIVMPGITELGGDVVATGSGAVVATVQAAATARLTPFVGDTGTGGVKGLVPAPAAGDAAKFLKADGTWAPPGGSSGLLATRIFSTPGAGTYVPTAGTASVVIEQVGGGGGGGGSAATIAGQGATGAGGTGGGYVRTRLTTGFSGAAYVIGAKGTGGAAGNNAGTAGGNTTFSPTGGGSVITAGGGTAGGGAAAGSNLGIVFRVGAAGGVCTNGDLRIPGGPSSANNLGTNLQASVAGAGGGSVFSPPTVQARSFVGPVAGAAAVGAGGGGGGAVSNEAAAAAAGGNGADGLLIIWEYGSLSSGASDFTWLEEQTPSGVSAVTFSSLGAFTHLKIVMSGRTTAAANNTVIDLRFNGDAGANYDRQYYGAAGTALIANESLIQTVMDQVANLAANTAPTGATGAADITIFDYRNATLWKRVSSVYSWQETTATGGMLGRTMGGNWRSTAAITSITIQTRAAVNFATGTRITLYGLK